jgi:hypothetical protein
MAAPKSCQRFSNSGGATLVEKPGVPGALSGADTVGKEGVGFRVFLIFYIGILI